MKSLSPDYGILANTASVVNTGTLPHFLMITISSAPASGNLQLKSLRSLLFSRSTRFLAEEPSAYIIILLPSSLANSVSLLREGPAIAGHSRWYLTEGVLTRFSIYALTSVRISLISPICEPPVLNPIVYRIILLNREVAFPWKECIECLRIPRKG